jgi:hypothetical protein
MPTFYGDNRASENPRDFLKSIEALLSQSPNTSDPEKCHYLYLQFKSGFDAEEWYENLESNFPTVVASWSTLVKHFRVKWLGGSPDLLLETPKSKPVTPVQLDVAASVTREMNTTAIANSNTIITATTTTTAVPKPVNPATPTTLEPTTVVEPLEPVADVRHVMTMPAPARTEIELTTIITTTTTATTTATILAHTDTAAPAILEPTTTPQQLDTRHVTIRPTPVPAQPELELTTITTTTDSNKAVTTVKQQDNEELAAEGEEEQERRAEKQEEIREQRAEEREELDAGEQEMIEGHQSEVRVPALPSTARTTPGTIPHKSVQFDWATDVDVSIGLSPIAFDTNAVHDHHTTQVRSNTNPQLRGNTTPFDPDPGDVAADPVGVTLASTVPTKPIPVDPAPILFNPASCDVAISPDGAAPTKIVPTEPVPIDPMPVHPAFVPHIYLIPATVDTDTDLGDVTTDPICAAFTSPVPVNCIPVDPDPALPIHVKPETIAFVSLINPDSGDFTTGLVNAVFTSIVPTEPVEPVPAMPTITGPVDPDPDPDEVAADSVDPDPILLINTGPAAKTTVNSVYASVFTKSKPIPLVNSIVAVQVDPDPDDSVTHATAAVNTVSTPLVNPIPAEPDPIAVEPTPNVPNNVLVTFINPSNIAFIGYPQAFVNPICITPIAPVHVDPVTAASTTANFIAVAIRLCAHHILVTRLIF